MSIDSCLLKEVSIVHLKATHARNIICLIKRIYLGLCYCNVRVAFGSEVKGRLQGFIIGRDLCLDGTKN